MWENELYGIVVGYIREERNRCESGNMILRQGKRRGRGDTRGEGCVGQEITRVSDPIGQE